MENIPIYRMIQKDILEQIEDGRLLPGERIPTEKELMKQYGVSRITTQKAMSELKQQGVLIRKPRVGSFVREVDTAEVVQAVQVVDGGHGAVGRIDVGVVAPFNMEQSHVYRYLDGIMFALDSIKDNVTLQYSKYVQERDRMMLDNCLKSGCKGILYYPGNETAPTDLLIWLSVQNYPCILMDKHVPNANIPCVQIDNVQASQELMEHLIGKGHRNIAFLADAPVISCHERYLGFCLAMKVAGLTSSMQRYFILEISNQTEELLIDMIQDWLRKGITAVCCSTDDQAKAVYDVCGRMGVDVPGELAVAGFDGIYPGVITSMLQPYAEIGHTAMQRLLRWIRTGEPEIDDVMLKAQLVVGDSTVGKTSEP